MNIHLPFLTHLGKQPFASSDLLCAVLVPIATALTLFALWATVHDKASMAQKRLNLVQTQQHNIYLNKERFILINAQRSALAPPADAAGSTGIPKSALYMSVEKSLTDSKLMDLVQSMRPGSAQKTNDPNGRTNGTPLSDNDLRESLVLRLNNLDMAQLVRFLYATEIVLPQTILESGTLRKNNNGFLDLDVVLATSVTRN